MRTLMATKVEKLTNSLKVSSFKFWTAVDLSSLMGWHSPEPLNVYVLLSMY